MGFPLNVKAPLRQVFEWHQTILHQPCIKASNEMSRDLLAGVRLGLRQLPAGGAYIDFYTSARCSGARSTLRWATGMFLGGPDAADPAGSAPPRA